MDKSIKTLGLHDIRVTLHPEVAVTVVVNVARSLDEAETQMKTGVAVTGGVQDVDDEPDAIAEAIAAVEEVEAAEAVEDDTSAVEAAPADADDDSDNA
jgi:large subunit ribosomal protein L9